MNKPFPILAASLIAIFMSQSIFAQECAEMARRWNPYKGMIMTVSNIDSKDAEKGEFAQVFGEVTKHHFSYSHNNRNLGDIRVVLPKGLLIQNGDAFAWAPIPTFNSFESGPQRYRPMTFSSPGCRGMVIDRDVEAKDIPLF